MHESRQTTVEFPGVTDNTRGSIQHSLQPICNDLPHPGENCIAVIHTRQHESVDKCGSRLKESSGHRMRLSCRSLKKPPAQTLATCLLRLRSDKKTPRRRTCLLAVTVYSPSRKLTPQSPKSDRLCFVLAQTSSVLSALSFRRLADIQWPMSVMRCSS